MEREFLKGLNKSVTQFHAVNHCKKKLLESGQFEELRERDEWKLESGRGYIVTRNNSTIVAFKIAEGQEKKGLPSKYKVIGCHTDSPVLKLAPNSAIRDKQGFNQLNVQTYGGGLWHTWFDRDLTLAGKVILAQGNRLVTQYWHAKDEPLLKIANLAIHLTDKTGVFEPNKETHLKPILSTSIIEQLIGP